MKAGKIASGRVGGIRGSVSVAAVLLCLGVGAGGLLSNAVAAISGGTDSTPPKFVTPFTKAPAKGTRANVVADKLTYDSKRKIATATGLVRITYGPYVLTATKVVYDVGKDIFKANGSVELREPNGNVLQADYSEISNKFKEGFAEHVKALLTNDVTITADYAKRTEDGITVYEHATYTACKDCVGKDGSPLWQIVAKRATHDQQTKTIYYDNPRFEIAGVPVFWAPYLAYPDPTVKRRSGFLIPNASHGPAYGFGVTTPYFLVLAPNADLTISPRWTYLQGPVADLEFRHRLNSGQYSVTGYGVHQFDRKASGDDSSERGALRSNGQFMLNDVWSWGWNGTLVSDRTFLDDYDFDNADMVTSDVHVVGMADRSYISAQMLHYQTMLTNESQDRLPTALPYVTASHTFAEPVLGGELGFDVNAYSLNREESAAAFGLGTEQTRGIGSLHWQKQMINGLGQAVTPFVRVRGEAYVSEDVPGTASSQETTAQLLPSAGVDVRWPFIAEQGFGQDILTPVVQLIAAGGQKNQSDIGPEDAITLNFDHTNLFLQERTSGFDRHDSGTRANAGLMYSFLGENGGFARMSLGESFHIAGENSFATGSGLDGPVSDLIGALAVQPNEYLRLTYEARAEEDMSRINSQEASISLTWDRFSGSLSYADIGAAPAYGRPEHEEQIWTDASYNFDEAWSVFGNVRYDLSKDKFMDKIVGVAFDCDCMKAKLTYSEGNTDDTGNDAVNRSIKLSVEFRTIGKIGGSFGF